LDYENAAKKDLLCSEKHCTKVYVTWWCIAHCTDHINDCNNLLEVSFLVRYPISFPKL